MEMFYKFVLLFLGIIIFDDMKNKVYLTYKKLQLLL